MAYNVHEFKSGDKLYAAQLNEMDTQIAANTEEIDTLKNSAVTSWNDLTDVPFGEKEEYAEIIPETSVTFSTGGGGEYKETFSSYGALAYGDYKVIFDGKEYYVSAVYQGINMMPAGEMSEEMPFQFMYSFGKLYAFKPGKHTISVYRKQMVVTPIPKKYIPWGVTWMHLTLDGNGKYNVYHGKTANGNTSWMKKSEFLEAFENGIVMHDACDCTPIVGHVCGYKINDYTGGLTLSCTGATVGVVFASE